MTALVPAATETALAPFVARVKDYIGQSRAANTRRGYRSDWRDFAEFCGQHGFCAMPAAPETVCAYLSAAADSGLKAGTIQRRVSAIAAAHSAAGQDNPCQKAAVRLCLAGIRRALGTRQTGKAPVLTGDVAAMVATLPKGLLGIRDRALLLVGFAGAFRRSELVGLNVEDLQLGEDGAKVMIGRSKTDQEGTGQMVGIARGTVLCPVRALETWLSAAGITTGPVFRAVRQPDHVQRGRLTDQVVATLVKRCARAAGLNPGKYSGHSLRAGLVTQAAMNGVATETIMKQTRHRSVEMVMRYMREAALFRENASARVGL